jgi:hypothetical protein
MKGSFFAAHASIPIQGCFSVSCCLDCQVETGDNGVNTGSVRCR